MRKSVKRSNRRQQETNGFLEAGAVMRTLAVKQQRRRSKSHSPDSRNQDDGSDKEMEMLQKEIESRNIFEDVKVRIQEERLDMEKTQDTREATHQEWSQKLKGRRVAVDERRTELQQKRLAADLEEHESNKETQRFTLEEQKALITVLGSMARKLNLTCQKPLSESPHWRVGPQI